MTITQGLIDTIRKLLNESIPETGTEADTRFTNMMIVEVLSEAASKNQALFLLWTQKAGLVQNGGEIKQINAGSESTVLYTKMEYVDMCQKTAAMYRSAWDREVMDSNSFSAVTMRNPEESLW